MIIGSEWRKLLLFNVTSIGSLINGRSMILLSIDCERNFNQITQVFHQEKPLQLHSTIQEAQTQVESEAKHLNLFYFPNNSWQFALFSPIPFSHIHFGSTSVSRHSISSSFSRNFPRFRQTRGYSFPIHAHSEPRLNSLLDETEH